MPSSSREYLPNTIKVASDHPTQHDEVSQRADIKGIDSPISLTYKNLPVTAILDGTMLLRMSSAGAISTMVGTNGLSYANDEERARIDTWKQPNWKAELIIPGYLWKPLDGTPKTKLAFHVQRNDLEMKTLPLERRQDDKSVFPHRDPIYWALNSEGWLSAVQFTKPITWADDDAIVQLAALLSHLQEGTVEWNTYRTMAFRVTYLDAVALVSQSFDGLLRRHISAATLLFLAWAEKYDRRSNYSRACERADSTWMSMMGEGHTTMQPQEKKGTSSSVRSSPRAESGQTTALSSKPGALLDVALVRIEACLCSGGMKKGDLLATIQTLQSDASKFGFWDYNVVLTHLQEVLKSGMPYLSKECNL